MANQVNGLLSPFLRDQRIRAARPYLRGRVLDFGCGTGALCVHVDPARYLGMDLDADSVNMARKLHPDHEFMIWNERGAAGEGPGGRGKFDTVAALAVIEHVDDPAGLLGLFRGALNPEGEIVLTTPAPFSDSMHAAGSALGIFSREAHQEHKLLIDKPGMDELAGKAGLEVRVYRRFLLGVNQLFVLAVKS